MSETMRKITISLPDELVAFADDRAQELHTSRSQVIGMALAVVKSHSEERLAAEGYQFYGEESRDFAALSGEAVAEAWDEVWLPREDEDDQDAR